MLHQSSYLVSLKSLCRGGLARSFLYLYFQGMRVGASPIEYFLVVPIIILCRLTSICQCGYVDKFQNYKIRDISKLRHQANKQTQKETND
jgi:hypothetical protein